MIRQFLYGMKIFRDELNVNPDVFWLPDTFGYSGQLPQILKGFNIKYFISQKLSWNLYNTFPHSTFNWVGIDGSTILTHFPPADTYNSFANVKDLVKSCENNKSKQVVNRSLLAFGNGDGGGGPGFSHLESLKRLQNCPHLPRIHLDKTPSEFFQDIEKYDFLTHPETSGEKDENELLQKMRKPIIIPTWNGELYLELHQGTFTSQARTKLYNRRCENLMRGLEALLVAVAYCHSGNDDTDMNQDIQRIKNQFIIMWKSILLNQFHDVIRKLT